MLVVSNFWSKYFRYLVNIRQIINLGKITDLKNEFQPEFKLFIDTFQAYRN